ncbi:Large proline-rich protein bag6 [Quillaja saponaria]|uniref:Large proline-rich protein bag6 n=1 Tax=Quillaja saponaria TaxID=32244 RepID=A0AAD7LHH4_QUISA|nr:Large proline-rich protein bag6 [Quillaja saponaria]
MEINGTDKIARADGNQGSETTIEIKIKTLDSQTYTLRVDKQMPVPALKEQIASITGVLSDQQRLICRGKVLKDDQLLSAYHVEDGHTLHLVVRQPVLPLSDGLPNHSATDPNSSTSQGHNNQVAPGVVIETFSMPVHGSGVPLEVNRLVSAVLGSIGMSSIFSGSEGIDVREHHPRGLERTSGSSGMSDLSQPQHEQAGVQGPSDRSPNTFGLPSAVSFGPMQPPVISDSLSTLSQYLSHISRELDAIIREADNVQAAEVPRTEGSGSASGTATDGLSTPASLAAVFLSTRQMFVEQAGTCLLQLAGQLESQANVTDPLLRSSTQSNAWRTGSLFYNLGAFLLELGRTTMTLHLGQTQSEAVVNGGPAVFISPSGPNPIMVQPLPFQSGTSFGAIPMTATQPGSLPGGLSSGFHPRRIDIQIRRGPSTTTPNATREERGGTEPRTVQSNPSENSGNQATSRVSEGTSFAGESGIRVMPFRTMVAAVPSSFSRVPSESSDNSTGLYYPVLGRFQHVSGHGTEQGSQPSTEQHPSNLQTEQQSVSGFTVQRQNIEDPTRNGSLPTADTRQEPSNTRTININILSANGTHNNQDSERQIPNNVLQYLRALFPGGEIHVEDPSLQGTATPVSEHLGASRGVAHVPEAEPRVTDEGVYLSNLLREIMPLISCQAVSETNAPPEGVNVSEDLTARNSSTHVETDVGTSRRQSGHEPNPPNSKRQKTE